MITASQCKTYSTECRQLGMERDISVQRATALMAMANAWNSLEHQTERLSPSSGMKPRRDSSSSIRPARPYTRIVARESAPRMGGAART
jgi:hypothetical protein